MKTTEEYNDFINSKLQVLLKKYASLQKENADLKNEIEIYKEKYQRSLQKINSLETQVSILKTSAGTMNEDEKKNFEKKINQYIKDIDKCITILNN